GLEALRRSGTALVGEVSNTGASLKYLENSELAYHLFYECLGFNLLEPVDLGESLALLAEGNGFLRDLLKRRGRWLDAFQPPGESPAAYLQHLGFLGPRTLAVHGVWLDEADW